MANVSNPIAVMKRHELKYVLTKEQTEYLTKMLKEYMVVDEFGKTSIASLYYDTPDCRLIRASIENPPFKEKLRLRSYGMAKGNSPVFLELKRKYDGVVYKRRVASTLPEVEDFFNNKPMAFGEGQIARELSYFRDMYKNLEPSCLVIYDRIAYFEPGGDLRLTIDYNPRYRLHDLNLTTSMEGISLLDEGQTILEIKVQAAMPLWLTHILDEGGIRKTSFSKYGNAFKREAKCMLLVA